MFVPSLFWQRSAFIHGTALREKRNELYTERHISKRERIVDGHLRKLWSFPAAFVVHDIRRDSTGRCGLRKEVVGPGGARERYEHAIVNAIVLRERPTHTTHRFFSAAQFLRQSEVCLGKFNGWDMRALCFLSRSDVRLTSAIDALTGSWLALNFVVLPTPWVQTCFAEPQPLVLSLAAAESEGMPSNPGRSPSMQPLL